MLNKAYHNEAEIRLAFLNGVKVYDNSPVAEPSGDMGLRRHYSGSGWYKATDTGTVFCKGVPEGEIHIFSDSPEGYVSVYNKQDAKLYGESAAVSNITDMSLLFIDDAGYNRDISSWDTSNVNTMFAMFGAAQSFNRDISSWDVSNVTNMGNMFYVATSFNQDISTWDTSRVKEMGNMFNSAESFNQDLSSWCVPNIFSPPSGFSSPTYTLPKPVWGTCPRGENQV